MVPWFHGSMLPVTTNQISNPAVSADQLVNQINHQLFDQLIQLVHPINVYINI
jgi:hypothetical protein